MTLHSKGIFLLIFTKLSAFHPLEKIQADEELIWESDNDVLSFASEGK